MLSRSADSCFWIGRYVERAEAIARLIDVQYHFGLETPHGGALPSWEPILESTGGSEAYYSRYEGDSDRNILYFFAFDETYPNSIASCIRRARENARSIREEISSEMWEHLNTSYHELGGWDIDRVLSVSPHAFFRFVRNVSHLFQGILHRTLTISDIRYFLDAGRFLERAGQTSRILDTKYRLLGDKGTNGGMLDIHGWISVLKSVGGFEAFRKTYPGGITPEHVAAFLILNGGFPAAVIHCVARVETSLRRISGNPPGTAPVNASEREAGRLYNDLRFLSEEELTQMNLHRYLAGVINRCDDIGSAIVKDYLSY